MRLVSYSVAVRQQENRFLIRAITASTAGASGRKAMMGVPLLEACDSVHKRRPRLLLFVVITCALAQCCIAVPAYAGSPTSVTKSSQKDPKICSLLRDLREQIPQQSHAFGQSPVRRLAF